MPLLLVALLLSVLLALVGIILLSLALRYRAGTTRRRGRRWVATTNVWVTSFSALFFLLFASVLHFWVARAFPSALAGVGGGAVVGLLGLALTRWEAQPEGLFYTPSRWLALLFTLVIASRLVYGWYRSVHSGGPSPFFSAASLQLSIAIAGGFIGYYLVYAIGVRRRLTRHERIR